MLTTVNPLGRSGWIRVLLLIIPLKVRVGVTRCYLACIWVSIPWEAVVVIRVVIGRRAHVRLHVRSILADVSSNVLIGRCDRGNREQQNQRQRNCPQLFHDSPPCCKAVLQCSQVHSGLSRDQSHRGVRQICGSPGSNRLSAPPRTPPSDR